ncbi:hypothetical protein WME91_15945 [Sorangium sp. So ce269]
MSALRHAPRLARWIAALAAALFASVTARSLCAGGRYPTPESYVGALPVVGVVTPFQGEPTGTLSPPGAASALPIPVYESRLPGVVIRCAVVGEDLCMVFLEPAVKPPGWDSLQMASVAVRRGDAITVRRDSVADTWVLVMRDEIVAHDGRDLGVRPLPFSDTTSVR